MQDGRQAHVGIHHCDGGPEPAHHRGPLVQVEGMPMPEAAAVPGDAPTTVAEGGPAVEREDGGTSSSTDGESDTCVDEGTLCASASRCCGFQSHCAWRKECLAAFVALEDRDLRLA
jgi:hypothetical protein